MELGLVRRVAALLSKAGIVKTILGRDAQAFPKLCLPGLSRRAALSAGDAGGAARCGRPDDHAVRAKLSAQELAAKATQDAAIWEALASEQIEAHRQSSSATAQQSAALQQQNKQLQAELLALSAAAQALPVQQLEQTIALAAAASDAIELDEAATRKLIDQQLRSAGWEVDTDRLTFAKGARPVPGKNLAIAEWPTLADGQEGRADYVLFAGLVVVAIVEAKRKHKDV